jgi:hypothetical protein
VAEVLPNGHLSFPTAESSDDFLLGIFDHLNDPDLFQCEAVCSQWRRILLCRKPWKSIAPSTHHFICVLADSMAEVEIKLI